MSNSPFHINCGQMEALVKEGLSRGGGWCDLFFEYTTGTEFYLRDSEIKTGSIVDDYGCGIRVLDGDKTGYAYSESTDIPSLLKAAQAAASIASGKGGSVHIPPVRELPQGESYGKCAPVQTEKILSFMQRLDNAIRSKDARISKVIVRASVSNSEIMMYNSLGELCLDSRPLAEISVSTSLSQGKLTDSTNASRSFRLGAGMFSDDILNELIDEATAGIDTIFEAGRPKGGKMSVVMGAGASGILLHEAMGHAFEADFNRKGQSIFSGMIGKRICGKGINIVDDGKLMLNRGACNYDDEGVPGQKTYMVRDGILTSYLHDRISAAYYGVPPTGNGRRESFRYNPIPRMRATYMENGSCGEAQDLIADVKKGIFVDKFSNGQVKIGEGDFTFYVKRGYLIENGRLTMPIKDTNIIGNGPQALADITAVASDLKIDNGCWTCGKEQNVPVSCGMPTVLVKNLTVGGEE